VPDHAGIMVLQDAILGAELRLRPSHHREAQASVSDAPPIPPIIRIAVLSAVSGSNSPLKMAPMIAQADMAVVTKTDLVSQAEKEVFREYIKEVAPSIDIIETNAIQGTGMRYLMKALSAYPDLSDAAQIVSVGHLRLESVPSASGRRRSDGSTILALYGRSRRPIIFIGVTERGLGAGRKRLWSLRNGHVRAILLHVRAGEKSYKDCPYY